MASLRARGRDSRVRNGTCETNDGGPSPAAIAAGHSHAYGIVMPITVPGGVYVLPTEVVRDVGHGDLKRGLQVLDQFVVKIRRLATAERRKLPLPI